jgi:hypothetical protein
LKDFFRGDPKGCGVGYVKVPVDLGEGPEFMPKMASLATQATFLFIKRTTVL